MTDLEEFHQQLIADVQGDADALGVFTIEAFFEKTCDFLTEAGEIESANRAYFEGRAGNTRLQFDGYGGDPRDADNILSLIICDFELSPLPRTIQSTEVKKLFKRMSEFLRVCRDSDFMSSLEETSSGYGVADLVSTTWKKIEKIKLIVVSNADFRAKADAISAGMVDGKPVTFSVWDLKRIKRYVEQGQVRENLIIDFEIDFGGSIPVLRAFGGVSSLESYIAVIPGVQLAKIYDKWGPRLLESNVRSFLQARGKVNQGIRNTIRDTPHMFLSYNNGISVTADSVVFAETRGTLSISKIDNLQIVNGGQTTASVHAALKTSPENLDDVFVQMKLSIVPHSDASVVVPKISEYANSQNTVNAADFSANTPFHVRIEEFSRKILAPAGREGYRETKWFYERARGQYADQRGRRTQAERKKFDAEYPRPQFFTKTDLAKFENSWSCLPHTVSLGAQKNFGTFAKAISDRWGKTGREFDGLWFRRLVAKAIVFKKMEKLVSSASWYEGGYRANIVTYGIAKIIHDTAKQGLLVDLDLVWRQQNVPKELEEALLVAGAESQDVITSPPVGVKNMGEWAKKQACWAVLSEREVVYSKTLQGILIEPSVANEIAREERADDGLTKSVEDQKLVFDIGSDIWASARAWGREHRVLSPMEIGVLEICAAIPNKLPSEKQCTVAIRALQKIKSAGFRYHSMGLN